MLTASSALSFQVMESEEFMLLPANQLIDIISSDELNVRSEEQVFNAVMAWVKYSIQERRPQLPQVRVLRKCAIVTVSDHTWCFLASSPVKSSFYLRTHHSETQQCSHMSFRYCSMSAYHCSAPSSWWAPSGQTLSLKVMRSAGGLRFPFNVGMLHLFKRFKHEDAVLQIVETTR